MREWKYIVIETDAFWACLSQTDDLKIHVTYIIIQLILYAAIISDISTKCLYSSFSFSINMQSHACSDHNTNHSVCGVPSVLWAGLTVSTTGPEGGQTDCWSQ
jgi:hypothetical protein